MYTVYVIQNMLTGKVYVGHTNNYVRREREHVKQLRANRHHSVRLQRAWNKYGHYNFEFSLLEHTTNFDCALKLEQYYIDVYDSSNKNFGYNVSSLASGGNSVRLYALDGVEKSLSQWADEFGLTHHCLYQRITTQNMSLKDALVSKRKPAQEAKLLFAFSQWKTMSEWCKQFNITSSVVYTRMRYSGLTLEEALKLPKTRGKKLKV